MSVASVVGLLAPALDEGSAATVAAGALTGLVFLLAARQLLGHRRESSREALSADARTSLLVFAVLFVHSLPEGFAIGTAYASKTAGLGLFVVLAIALQNIPEGTSVAIPMREAGYSGRQQFWAAVGTSAPQPVGALIAYALVEQISSLLPFSFAFAAGAMLSLVAIELVPQALAGRRYGRAAAGAAAGAAIMGALSLLIGV